MQRTLHGMLGIVAMIAMGCREPAGPPAEDLRKQLGPNYQIQMVNEGEPGEVEPGEQVESSEIESQSEEN